MKRGRRIDKSGESGFAMLLVLLMAAAIAISLYIQIPRVAFEAQRQKEQLLMERGEQYKRAIQLFVRANGRYPGKIDDLENFNNRRFLRHKFKDPVTGKTEWRLIHISAAGVFTDSLTNKPKQDDKNQSISTTGSVGVLPELGAAQGQPGQAGINSAAGRRRASEGGAAPIVLGPDGQPVQQQPNAGFPGAPGGQQFPGQPYPGAPQQSYQPYQPPTAPPGQVNPVGQPGYALVTPNPQMGAGNEAFGPPVPTEVGNLPGGAAQFGQQGQFPGQQPGQFAQPGQFPQPIQQGQQGQFPQPAPFRPPVAFQPPQGSNAGSQQGAGGSSSIGGASSSIGGFQSSLGGDNPAGSNQPVPGGLNPGQNRGFPQPVPPAQAFPQQPGGLSQPFGQPNPSEPGAFPPAASSQTGVAGFAQPNPQNSNPATSMIQNMLTTPRQGPQGTQPGGQQIGGGIAGVASTSEDASIMLYNDKSNYNEWEFIFDYTKQKAAPNASSAVVGTPVQNMGSVPQGNGASPNPGIGNSFGNSFGNGAGQNPNPQNQQQPPSDLRMGRQ